MAEERLACKVILVKDADGSGKKPGDFCTRRVELFRAFQWRRCYRPDKRNMHPRPPIHQADDYWQERFRVRLDGRWYNPGQSKYTFLTLDEVLKLVAKEMD